MLLLSRIDKPALLRRVLELACAYSGRILSYTKMIGQLQDAGNTTTAARYLDLLAGAGLVAGLQKYNGGAVRRRASSPKLQVLNNALVTAQSGLGFNDIRGDPPRWGRLVESAAGAHLANAAASGGCELFYWRERNQEVDFVVRSGNCLAAVEVKSGRAARSPKGMAAFSSAHGSGAQATGGRRRDQHRNVPGNPGRRMAETPDIDDADQPLRLIDHR